MDRLPSALAALIVFSLAGCGASRGAADDSTSEPEVEEPPPMASGGAPPIVVPEGMGGAQNLPPVEDPPPGLAPLRRLTHLEYENTIADLFGDTSGPAAGFAPEVAQDGFTNNALGQTVSPALAEQYVTAAENIAARAVEDLPTLLGCDPAAVPESDCIGAFIRQFGERAWRRPLRDPEVDRLWAVYQTGRATFPPATALKMVLEVLIGAPQFLYLLEAGDASAAPPEPGAVLPLGSFEVASRLSYFLTGSMPDAELFQAAAEGVLSTAEGIALHARRLLETSRARQRIELFFVEWLELRHLDRLQKDPELFPNYDLAFGALLREQARRFASHVVLDANGTPAELLTASYTFVTPELAPLYGVPAPSSTEFGRIELDPSRTAGLLTHVGVLANLAKSNQTDPVHRGKFIRERLLCEKVPAPPANANITPPEIRSDATTRERFAQHRADPACAGCHQLMDPIGLGFENYDALGQWRDTENGLPVDASGEILGTDVSGPFTGAVELAHKLAGSAQVSACFAESWFRFALGRSLTHEDQDRIRWVSQQFAAAGFRIEELLIALTQSRSFRSLQVPDPAAESLAGAQPDGEVTP